MSESGRDGLECVPVVDGPARPGDPCSLTDGPHSGADNCAFGAYCRVDQPDDHGTCLLLCSGPPEAPVCPTASACLAYQDTLNLCVPWCDPLAQDCSNDEMCIVFEDDWFCVLGGVISEPEHAPCQFANECERGLICVEPDAAMECDPLASGCCEAICDVTAENTCSGKGQQCQPWYPADQAPPGFEKVGVCRP